MRVLVIDDDVSLLVKIKMEFDDEPFTVDGVSDFKKAIEIVENEAFDLVILDYVIGKNRVAGSTIGNILSEKGIPFIFITGHHSSDIFEEMMSLRPLTYLQKPLDFVALSFQVKSFFKSVYGLKEDFAQAQDGYLYIKKNSKVHRLNYNQIKLVEGSGNYITLISDTGIKYVLRSSLKNFLKEVNSSRIIRIHRKFLINVNFVENVDFQKKTVHLEGESVPFGRVFKENLVNLIDVKH